MTNKTLYIVLASMLAAALPLSVATAVEHTKEALQHANEAARSTGDAKSVGEHSTKALQHIEKAKAANPELAKKLERSEADLRSAVKNANRYNTDSAAQDAADAKTRLETVDH